MTRLQAILLDIDDTLFSTREFSQLARRSAVEAMVAAGLQVTIPDVVRELEEVIREFSSNYEHHFDKLLMRFPAETHAGVNPALIVTAGVVAYHDTKFEHLEPFPDVKPFLTSLKRAGIKAGIVSHGWTKKQFEKLIRLRLVPYLDPLSIFVSDQLGISKPNPKLYSTALRALALEPPDVMMVGDNLVNDIAPPQSLGMKTAWAKRSAKEGQDVEKIVPDHTIESFADLTAILREEYGATV